MGYGLWLLVVVLPLFTPMLLPAVASLMSSPTTVNTLVPLPRPKPSTTPVQFSTSCSAPQSHPRARPSSLVVVLPTSPTLPLHSRVSSALSARLLPSLSSKKTKFGTDGPDLTTRRD